MSYDDVIAMQGKCSHCKTGYFSGHVIFAVEEIVKWLYNEVNIEMQQHCVMLCLLTWRETNRQLGCPWAKECVEKEVNSNIGRRVTSPVPTVLSLIRWFCKQQLSFDFKKQGLVPWEGLKLSYIYIVSSPMATIFGNFCSYFYIFISTFVGMFFLPF